MILCHYLPQGITTVPETVAYMQNHSAYSTTVLNLLEHGGIVGTNRLSKDLNLRSFDVVVIHNSLAYNVDNLRSLDAALNYRLRDFQGVKVLMKQDENFRFQELAKYIGETKFDLVFTCLPQEAIPLVYPEAIAGKPKFCRMLTGYVTPTLRAIPHRHHRPNDIVYRGSVQPLNFGKLAYEKRKIGEDVFRLLSGRNYALDISSRWEDRIGGPEWIDFLTSGKATLAAESGASIFDLKQDLDERCKRAEQKYGPFRDDAEYAEKFLADLADLENCVNYGQVSPRHFEAVAARTLQLMYPGNYSGIFVAGRHYVELARDYSNLDQAMDVVRDETARARIVECAYEEIVNNPRYWIETFVANSDALIDEALKAKNLSAKSALSTGKRTANVLLICGHKPSVDPRIGWIAEGAPSSLEITQLGVVPADLPDMCIEHTRLGHLVVSQPLVTFTPSMFNAWMIARSDSPAEWAALAEISFIQHALSLPEPQFLELFGAPAESERVSSHFKWYLRYILNTTATLVSCATRVEGCDAIVATDLDTLPAALILKGLLGIPVLYDAHEYWPEADVSGFEFEREFWIAMERRLLEHVDRCQTVTPGLAALMSAQYGKTFHVVPNCEPPQALMDTPPIKSSSTGSCTFIYQGGFAPARGLDLLISIWATTDPRARLLLRGPDNPYKSALIEQARSTGLLDKRIFFPAAVKESELVAAAQDGDVGLIPYTPSGSNYSHCCPNKMSQYMAAGLPIFANRTSFVRETVEAAGAGLVIDFGQPARLVEAILYFVENLEARMAMGAAARKHFKDKFNWALVSQPMYDALREMCATAPAKELVIRHRRIQADLYHVSAQPVAPADPWVGTYPRAIRAWRLLPASLRGRLGPLLEGLAKSVLLTGRQR